MDDAYEPPKYRSCYMHGWVREFIANSLLTETRGVQKIAVRTLVVSGATRGRSDASQ